MCHVCDNSCHVVIQVYCGCVVFDASSGHSFSGLYDSARVAIRLFFLFFLHLIRVMHAVTSAYRIWLMRHQC